MGVVIKRNPPSGRSLLTENDFNYLGYYGFTDSTLSYGKGLTHRRVSGTLRLMTLELNTGDHLFYPKEFTLPVSFGQNVTLRTTMSDSVAQQDDHAGLYFDESGGRLITTRALDYPQLGFSSSCITAISTYDINNLDVMSNFMGYYGLEDVGQRAIYGGIKPVPTWFQTANSVGPYVVGIGGYSSLMGQGLGPALGPFLAFIPEPTGYTELSYGDTTGGIPDTDYKIGADYRSGAVNSNDWFTNYSGRTFDRGPRGTTTVTNWYDGNDTRSNPATIPTYPTDFNSGSPHWWVGNNGGAAPNDPDSYSRFVWGDSYWNTINWIDNDAGTRNKHGIIGIATLSDGYAWYHSSGLESQGKEYEIHIFDPDDVADCIAGNIAGYKVRPVHTFSIRSLLDGPIPQGANNSPYNETLQATFDSVDNRLYIFYTSGGTSSPAFYSRVYVFEVDE